MSEPDENCLICSGRGFFDKPLPNNQVEFSAICDCWTQFVMLPPYVEPKHRKMLEDAESMLEEYSQHLLERIKKELFDNGWAIEPHPDDIRKAERRFHEDPTRALLVKQLAKIKSFCERPRFMVNGITPNQP